MIKTIALAAAVAFAAGSVCADAVVTLSGKRVEGTIVSENDEIVVVRTNDYGELSFHKINLKEIVRGSSGSATGGGSSANPFGGTSGSSDPFGSSGGSSNPFGSSGASANPFGSSGGSSNPFASSSGANPFGSGTSASANPFGSTGSSPNPFNSDSSWGNSVEISPGGQTPGQGSAIQTDFPPPGPRRVVTPPEVPFSWDAVLFDIPEDQSVRVKIQPGTPFVTASEATNLRVGAEIETDDAGARIVFKNGRDMVRIAPHTLLRVLNSDSDRVGLELARGSIWADASAEHPNRAYLVRFSNGGIYSTGGVFRVADALDRGFHVAVIEGSADVVSLKAQIQGRLEDGEMLALSPSGVLTPTMPVSRIVEHEDANFDTLPKDWWLRADRIGVDKKHKDEMSLVSINRLRGYVGDISQAFMKFTQDTGHIPTSEEAFTVLRQNMGNWPGWNGPYWDGVLPPVDSWARPMRYTTLTTDGTDRHVGIVYSIGEDNIDNGGDASADIAEMILYYQLENVAAASNRPL